MTESVEPQQAVSFVDLVEVIVIGGLRKEGFGLEAIRKMNASQVEAALRYEGVLRAA